MSRSRARQQNVQEDRKTDSECCERARAGSKKTHPAKQKRQSRTVRVANEHVLATGAWPNRSQLCVGQRAREREQSSYDPDDDHTAWRADVARHHARLQKHAGPDDVSNDDRGGCDWTKSADQSYVTHAATKSITVRRIFSRKGAKKGPAKRGSALRLCAFAGDIFTSTGPTLLLQSETR